LFVRNEPNLAVAAVEGTRYSTVPSWHRPNPQ